MSGISAYGGYDPSQMRTSNQGQTKSSGASKSSGGNFDAVYEDPSSQDVSVDQFLNLMITQLQNQDFMNPMDDTQYVTQLAQFATMQHMQELSYHSESTYATGLIGKEVTVAQLKIGGEVEKVTGKIDKVMLLDKEFKFFVEGKAYSMNQIMEIHSSKGPGESTIPDTESFTPVASEKTENSIRIDWPAFSTDTEKLKDAEYSLYYSKDSDFNTVGEVKKGTLVGEAERKELFSETITGLEEDTTYYVNVVVKHADGTETVYGKATTSTLKKK